ncbi:TetR/AcrR family transcriptional regulator [Coriobacteriales bacterium OH1046]|nr:TetR/AcrR family transcriptional regulator [Coriobacteriales bacterium OH1046]
MRQEKAGAKSTMRPFVELTHPSEIVSRNAYAITCAAALFLRDGIASVRMTDIADAAGIGVATLYRHYKTKTKIAICAGTFMWNRFNSRIRGFIEADEFLALSGAERLSMLFGTYIDAYTAHPDFVRFLDEFDHLMLAEGLALAELEAYGGAIDSFYIIFEDAYRLGLADGTIAREVDFAVFYRTIAHAMMGIAQKLVRGEIIPSDDFSQGRRELECIVQMARRTLGIADEG